MPTARNPSLEAAIVANWADEQAWAVYADWLQAHGDPLGEYLTLRQLRQQTKGAERAAIRGALIDFGRERLLGPELALLLSAAPSHFESSWKDPFMIRARFGPLFHAPGHHLLETLDALLGSAAGRFLEDLALEVDDPEPPRMIRQVVARLLAVGVQPALRRLDLASPLDHELEPSPATGRLAELMPLLPNLEVLRLSGHAIDLGAGLEHPRLTKLGLHGARIPLAAMPGLQHCVLPELTSLVVHVGSWRTRADDAARLLDLAYHGQAGLPKLHALSLDQPIDAAWLAAFIDSPLFARLGVLFGGAIDDAAAQLLLDQVHRFAHVRQLSLVATRLSPDVAAALHAALPNTFTAPPPATEDGLTFMGDVDLEALGLLD